MFTVFKCVSFCRVVEERAGRFPSITVLIFLSVRSETVNVSSPKAHLKICIGFG